MGHLKTCHRNNHSEDAKHYGPVRLLALETTERLEITGV